MNLAISTIILFLLITPGLAFKLSYFSTRYARKTVFLPLTEEVVSAIVPAFLLHVAGFVGLHLVYQIAHLSVCQFPWLKHWLICIRPNLGILASFESSTSIIDGSSSLWPNLEWQLVLFTSYLGLLSWVGVRVGHWMRAYVVKNEKLSEHPFLGPYSDWLEVMPLELTKGNTLATRYFDYLIVDLMVETAGQCYIYNGMLTEFYLKRDGALDRIVLAGTRRRVVDADPHTFTKWLKELGMDGRFYTIPGDYCVVDYRTVLNINVTYAEY